MASIRRLFSDEDLARIREANPDLFTDAHPRTTTAFLPADLAARLPFHGTATTVPARVYAADTPAHVDSDRAAPSAPATTAHVVYLTPSPGELYIGDDTIHALDTPGQLFTIPAGVPHGTRGTGASTRISLGPFNEAGRPVGFVCPTGDGTVNYYDADRETLLASTAVCWGSPVTILDFADVSDTVLVGQRFLGWTRFVGEFTEISYAASDTPTTSEGLPIIDLYPIFVTPPPSTSQTTRPSDAVLSTANAMVNSSAETSSVAGIALVRARRSDPGMRFPDYASYLKYQQGIARAQIRRAAAPQATAGSTATVPAPPTITGYNIQGYQYNQAGIQLDFTPPTNTGGSPILYYTARAYTSVSGPDVLYDIQRSSSGALPFITIFPLSVNVPYTFRMTATNAVGTSALSVASVEVTIPGRPDAPQNVTATPGNEQVTIGFTEPANNGGSEVLYYVVKTFLSADDSPVTPDVSGTTSPIIVTNLTNGTDYYFRVYAVNANGDGATAFTDPVTPLAPTAPTTPVLTVTPQNTALSVSIAFPSDGGESILSFSWWYSDGSTTTLPTVVTFTESPATITISGLTNGTPYTVFVTATNSVGTSSAGSAGGTPTAIPPELLRFDPSNSSSYSGSGSTVTSIGTSAISGTTNGGVSYTSSLVGGAFLFNGAGSITFNNFDFGQAFTVVAWVNPSPKASINAVLANETSGNNSSLNGFKLGWNSWNTSNHHLIFEGKGGGASTGTAVITDSTWQQLGYVMNIAGNTVDFYKNATQTGSQGTLPAALNTNTTKGFRIGTFTDGSYGMSGYLADIRVYPAALTQEQLQVVYDSTKSRYGL